MAANRRLSNCCRTDHSAATKGTGNHNALTGLAMTASASESDRARYLAAGFNAFLPKPIDSIELDDQLERFVSPTAQA